MTLIFGVDVFATSQIQITRKRSARKFGRSKHAKGPQSPERLCLTADVVDGLLLLWIQHTHELFFHVRLLCTSLFMNSLQINDNATYSRWIRVWLFEERHQLSELRVRLFPHRLE